MSDVPESGSKQVESKDVVSPADALLPPKAEAEDCSSLPELKLAKIVSNKGVDKLFLWWSSAPLNGFSSAPQVFFFFILILGNALKIFLVITFSSYI